MGSAETDATAPKDAVNTGSIKCVGFRSGDWGQALLAGSLCRRNKRSVPSLGIDVSYSCPWESIQHSFGLGRHTIFQFSVLDL